MIRHEDACAVCKELMIEYGVEMEEGLEELISNEMEQKCWISRSNKGRRVA